MNIKPLGQRIVAELLPAETKTQSGLIIPGNVAEKNQKAVVKAVSNELKEDTKNILKEGDKILFNKFSGEKFQIEGKEILIIEINDILAII
jgi:chaperonin GroES